MRLKYKTAKVLARFLPPILSQSVRNRIISIKEAEILNQDFVKRSITGSLFYGNTSDFHAFIFSVHGFFDWRNIVLTNTVLQIKQGHIIEVGANIGTETVSFSDIAKKYNSKVFAFEPLSSNLSILKLNRERNKLDNLEIFDCLVSNFSGTSFFSVPEGNNSGSGYILNSTKESQTQEFKVVSLDEQLNDEEISLISVDVEGFEFDVLRGGEKLIKKYAPVLILEVNQKYLEKRGKVKLLDFYNYLHLLNYDCYYIERLGITKVDIHLFKPRYNKNWICVPKESGRFVERLNKSIFYNAFKPVFKIK